MEQRQRQRGRGRGCVCVRIENIMVSVCKSELDKNKESTRDTRRDEEREREREREQERRCTHMHTYLLLLDRCTLCRLLVMLFTTCLRLCGYGCMLQKLLLLPVGTSNTLVTQFSYFVRFIGNVYRWRISVASYIYYQKWVRT